MLAPRTLLSGMPFTVKQCGGGDDGQESVWGIGLDVLSDIQLLNIFGLCHQRHSARWVPSASPWSWRPRENASTSWYLIFHYNDVIMTKMASRITSLAVVYSTAYSDADQRKHQSSASLAFVWRIHRDRWIPRTKASYAENVSIWWRQNVFWRYHLQ